MLSNDLTDLTEKQDIYGDGVLPTDFTLRWDPETPNLVLGCTVGSTQGKLEHMENLPVFSFNVMMTTGEAESPLSRVIRYMCHRVIDRIPEQGLYELSESLARMFRFYSEHPQITPLALTPPARKVSAKRGKTFQRPDFPVTSE